MQKEYQRQQRLLHPERYKAYEEKRKEKRREQYRLKKQQEKTAVNNSVKNQ